MKKQESAEIMVGKIYRRTEQYQIQSIDSRLERTHSALKKCVFIYEEGYRVVVGCDIKKCFDIFSHNKLIYQSEMFIQDKEILKIVSKLLMSGIRDMSGNFIESKTGAFA